MNRRLFINAETGSEVDRDLLFDLDCEGDNVINAVTGTVIAGAGAISANGGPDGVRCMRLLTRYQLNDPIFSEIGTGDFCIEFSMKLDSSTSDYRYILTTPETGYRFTLRFGDSGYSHYMHANPDTLGYQSSYLVASHPQLGALNKAAALNWIKYRIDRKANKVRIFVNDTLCSISQAITGTPMGSSPTIASNMAVPGPVSFGSNAAGSRLFNGSIHGFKIYKRSLVA